MKTEVIAAKKKKLSATGRSDCSPYWMHGKELCPRREEWKENKLKKKRIVTADNHGVYRQSCIRVFVVGNKNEKKEKTEKQKDIHAHNRQQMRRKREKKKKEQTRQTHLEYQEEEERSFSCGNHRVRWRRRKGEWRFLRWYRWMNVYILLMFLRMNRVPWVSSFGLTQWCSLSFWFALARAQYCLFFLWLLTGGKKHRRNLYHRGGWIKTMIIWQQWWLREETFVEQCQSVSILVESLLVNHIYILPPPYSE